jgi:acyl-CoA reductase-like NAD-dependent aldehyde dehydrogenase
VIGPLITDAAVQSVHSRVTEALAAGGKALTGATHHGKIYEPTILVDVPGSCAVSTVETFGPVGGVRDSGWGRTGTYSLADFTDLVWVNVESGQRELPIP